MTRERWISLAILVVWGLLLVPAFNFVVVPLIYLAFITVERLGGAPTILVTMVVYWGIIILAFAAWILTFALAQRRTLRRIRS